MKVLEFRRHSKRTIPSPHLNQEGIDKARKIGEELGEYDLIGSSYAPRAIETAVAMGYAVDEIYDELSMTPDYIEDEVVWGMNFSEFADVIKKEGKTYDYVKEMANFLLELAKKLPDNGSALLVSHGGLIELVAIGSFPKEDYSSWGKYLGTCEGVKIYIKDGNFEKIELLRI